MTMSEQNIPTEERVVQKNEGVKVTVQSTRGSGTRDQDKVTAYAYYDDIDEAYEHTEQLNMVVRSQMRQARQTDVDGNAQ